MPDADALAFSSGFKQSLSIWKIIMNNEPLPDEAP